MRLKILFHDNSQIETLVSNILVSNGILQYTRLTTVTTIDTSFSLPVVIELARIKEFHVEVLS